MNRAPGLLEGGALDEGEAAVEELHDKVLDLGGLRADRPLLLRQVGVVLVRLGADVLFLNHACSSLRHRYRCSKARQ